MSEQTELVGWLADRIPKAAREAVRRFPLVSPEDFEQEMWLRATVSNDAFRRDLAEGNEVFVWRKLKDTCHRYGMQDDRDRRARKAAAAGYTTYDEAFYTPQMVGHLLSELIQSEWDLPFAMDRATKGLDLTGVRVQSGGDSHDSYMDYLALLVDVKAAYDALKPYQQDYLLQWYGIGNDEDDEQHKWDREALAGSMGLSYDAFWQRKNRAVRALLHELGGESPYIQRRRGENAE
jgi:hypothetical protein